MKPSPLTIEACIANDRRASNRSPVFPAFRWSASIICYAAINKLSMMGLLAVGLLV